ncbi:orotate phosphoribosyltransferase [Anseongella ginsenosidimutans]|uniref:Orotate phosphoribosyltransferase n=1 Tax=Anseongella ginsenosidimutans TaxID=496056 RepID=A0A4R3KSB8_9SPHI|nr:orotate phosphoribosyltransferase [Anseongella ginsenosidimutans]
MVAEFLLQIKAIKLQPSNPFTWASGWKSPIYCDNRVTLSYPPIRTFIRQQLTHVINEEFGAVDLVAGVATGGIPQGVLVAQDLGLPFVYVRPEPKKHGRQNLIEGDLNSGQRVVVIEDLISTGKSSLQAVKALREAECDVAGMVAVFSYGFAVAEENLKNASCKYFTLTNYDALLKKAVQNGYILEEDVETLKNWRKSPETWGQ